MNLSPIDIKTKEFSTSFRGYDPYEVREYLQKLSTEVDELLTMNENLQVEAGELRLNIAEFKSLEKDLKHTLAKADENENTQVKSPQQNSSEIIKNAELKAAQIIDRAKESANEIRNAVLTLSEQKDLIIAKLKSMVETQTTLFESKIDPLPQAKRTSGKKESSDDVDVDVDDIVNKIL
jgi:cell division initiation protein